MKKLLMLGGIVFALSFNLHCQEIGLRGTDSSIAVMGVGQFTKPSIGYGYGAFQRQTSVTAFGPGVEWRQWWRNSGISVNWSAVATDANFTANGNSTPASLKRHEFSVMAIRRWDRGRWQPWAGAGGGGFITKGGWFKGAAPGETLGIDGRGMVSAGAGVDWRVGKRWAVRAGVNVDWFRAPDFSDAGYKASRTVMVEPKLGIVWNWGKP